MDRHERHCIEQMAKLYMMFTSPVAVFDKASGRMLRLSYGWTHPKAKELYAGFEKSLVEIRRTNAAGAAGVGGIGPVV